MHSETTDSVADATWESGHHGTEHGEETHGDWSDDFAEVDVETESLVGPQPAIGRFGAGLFTLAGFGLVACGAALGSSPWWSWQVSELASRLAESGLGAGSLVAGGLALFAAGRVGRSIARFSARPPLVDTDLVDSLGRMSEQVGTLAGAVANLQEEVTTLAQREPVFHLDAPAPDEDLIGLYRDQKDAVFRLAASLDKLAKNVTDQVAVEIGALDRQFETVRGGLETTSGTISRLIEASTTRTVEAVRAARFAPATGSSDGSSPGSSSGPPPAESTPPSLSVEAPGAALPTEAPTSLPESGPHAQAAVEEIVLEDPHPELEAEVSPLSFLDGLKDIAPPSQSPNTPNVEAPPLDFDLLDSVDAPLPGTPRTEPHPEPHQG